MLKLWLNGGDSRSTLIAPPRAQGALDVLDAGQRVDDFDLLEDLGSGAFARVFLARPRSMNRLVALKISHNRGREPQTLAHLNHQSIVRVFDQRLIEHRDLKLMYMEYVPGTGTAADLDVRSDIYALGVMLWELLTGCRPFDDEDAAGESEASLERMLQRRSRGIDPESLSALPPDCPATLRRVLLTCLAPAPGDRWSSGAELAQQFDLCLDAHARDLVDPPPRSWRLRVRRWIFPPAEPDSTMCGGCVAWIGAATSTSRSPRPCHWQASQVRPSFPPQNFHW